MDNFDLRTFLAEGKLHEETEALDRESVIDMAQMVADAFTQEDAGDSAMIYTVGKVDGLGFELDTQATENTPADDAKYGTGEGWGGSFRIEVLPNGYEIRNSEKGGLVATMDMEDGFRMLSADESRAELYGEPDVDWKNDELDMKRMEEGEEERVNEQAESLQSIGEKIEGKLKALGLQTKVFGGEFEVPKNARDMIEKNSKLGALSYSKGKSVIAGAPDGERLEVVVHKDYLEDLKKIANEFKMPSGSVQAFANTDFVRLRHTADVVDESVELQEYSSKIKKSELKEMIRAAFLNEAEGDEEEDVEADVEADVDIDVDADMDMDMDAGEDGINVKQDADAELGGTVGDVQDNLEAALEAARKLGDEKLEDQIGNTLTFFTRTHVVK